MLELLRDRVLRRALPRESDPESFAWHAENTGLICLRHDVLSVLGIRVIDIDA
ncbi:MULTISPECIES: hypothetical protein [unclassified Lysobacter]|uniref:hypothetical protein n=1 Tax=unclassified Lysobacter TaxID=2635362 RepID=UPI001BE90957|nr:MULTISPECIES: hypothetical protein [unclassified Lysobacter]MBT2747129.1 hypothetical protein [Lysobacter sp. ISL-42]MBT2752935.1 hypothetical protein [Lysobacter sp. ISL-50]MBT2778904.1 hypothetical protein [Lysobacter sp. ISL-54]MBT2784202.1 hypothetical protein [Lysobacter sp. ISL-52]